ncbi:IS66 family transposase [Pelomonas cellulosilytica]|uniref:IS66 family transposase n=1 Tax=Pelomonas cellulosilytica TaxID=2906762 RepID=UPI003B02E39F
MADHAIDSLDANQLREVVGALRAELVRKDKALLFKQTLVDKLTHENAVLKRLKFAAQSEAYTSEQKSLLDETFDMDLAAVAREIENAQPKKPDGEKRQPKRAPLPAHLPRHDVHHEPASTTCKCGCTMKRIGEDVSEKLDYTPGIFTVERHVRGKWVCAECETLVQAPMDPHIIDKGIPTTRLLAQVLVAKYLDHLPLYRQEAIFERAGMAIARSTLAQWVGECGVQLQPLVDALTAELLKAPVLHADETPVPMLKPGKGKTHRAYMWSWCTTQFHDIRAVVFNFAETRGGQNARDFLQLGTSASWKGSLVVDDFSGYKQCFDMGVTEAGCMAHARRKFHELWVNHQSKVGEQALKFFQALYDVERDAAGLGIEDRRALRLERAKPVADALKQWLDEHRQKVPGGSATAKALDYSRRRWEALTRYLGDGRLPIDNNWVENQIRPIALGRANWLFAGSLRAGKRAAAIMSLLHSARINGHDPYAYLRDVLERLPLQPASRIDELLPHRWHAPHQD